MLDQKFKKKWVSALKSGKFEKRMGKLKGNGRHCCLGVACELLPGFKWGQSYKDSHPTKTDDVSLNYIIRKLIGLSIAEEAVLINMNDEQRKSFKEIADHISKNL